jgi:PAS domain S-box-containing protein
MTTPRASSDQQERAFERALFASIELSPIATVVTNPRVPDNPIVAVNRTFCALTGYQVHEVLGRNCRFLAGGHRETSAQLALREAVAGSRALLVEVPNFKKDGTPFRNAVMVAPVLTADGVPGYFIGSQMDVGGMVDIPANVTFEAACKVERLTARQLDVLRGMLAGQLNKQIGSRLGIAEKTVKMHRAALFKRLGVRTSADAIRIGVEAELPGLV